MNIYVGNLPYTYDGDALRQLFEAYGEVTSAQVINDRETGRSRGFGFVEMPDDAGRKAIEELADSEVGGRRLTVNEARPRRPRVALSADRREPGEPRGRRAGAAARRARPAQDPGIGLLWHRL